MQRCFSRKMPILGCNKEVFVPSTCLMPGMHAWAQATGRVPDSDNMREGTLRGLLLVGDLNLDPSGRKLPWPLPSIGFGNAAHLANTTIT